MNLSKIGKTWKKSLIWLHMDKDIRYFGKYMLKFVLKAVRNMVSFRHRDLSIYDQVKVHVVHEARLADITFFRVDYPLYIFGDPPYF